VQNTPLLRRRPETTTPARSARRRETGTQAPQPLHAMPAHLGGAGGRTIIRISLSPSGSEWALVIAPPGLSTPCLPPDCLTGPYIRPLPGQFALVRVPGPASPDLGLAALHYRRGQTRTYCLATQIATDRAASALSALAGRAMDKALAAQAASEGADLEPRITVTRIGHDLLPAARHPAKARPDGHDLTIFACSDLITPQLGEVLSALWTTHTRYLLHLGRPRTQPGHRGRPLSGPSCRPASPAVATR
jgi:hypothetical protein